MISPWSSKGDRGGLGGVARFRHGLRVGAQRTTRPPDPLLLRRALPTSFPAWRSCSRTRFTSFAGNASGSSRTIPVVTARARARSTCCTGRPALGSPRSLPPSMACAACRGRSDGRVRCGLGDRNSDLLDLWTEKRPDARHARERGRARLRHPGRRRTRLHLPVDNGARGRLGAEAVHRLTDPIRSAGIASRAVCSTRDTARSSDNTRLPFDTA